MYNSKINTKTKASVHSKTYEKFYRQTVRLRS